MPHAADTAAGIQSFGTTARGERTHEAELLEAASLLLIGRSPVMHFTGTGYVIAALAALHRTYRSADEEADAERKGGMRALCAFLRPVFAVLGALLRTVLGEPKRIAALLRERHEDAIRASVGAPLALSDPRLANTSLVDVRIAATIGGQATEIVFGPSDAGIVLSLHGRQFGISALRGEGERIAITRREEPLEDVIRTEDAVEFRGGLSSVTVRDRALLGAIAELMRGASGVMLSPQYTSLAGAPTQTVRFDLRP